MYNFKEKFHCEKTENKCKIIIIFGVFLFFSRFLLIFVTTRGVKITRISMRPVRPVGFPQNGM